MRVLVVTGASGGHIVPALGFIEALRSAAPHSSLLLMLPVSRTAERLLPVDIPVCRIPRVRISRRLTTRTLRGGIALLHTSFVALKTLVNWRPDVVVGFGTVDSVPALLLAWLFRRKTLVHEQNVRIGKANAFLAKVVDLLAVSFPETGEGAGISAERVVVTGNPLRSAMQRMPREEARQGFGLAPDRMTILVCGGSQGSVMLNTTVPAALAGLETLQVIHSAGKGDCAAVRRAYQEAGIAACVESFIAAMHQAYSAADLVIGRAGALTVSELVYFGVPAILVPYPHAAAHQTANAQLLEKRGCAVIIKEKACTPQRLRQEVQVALASEALPQRRQAYEPATTQSAGQLLVRTVQSLVKAQ